MVWYSHLFQNFSQFIVIHTVKGFGIVKKAEIDVFLELSCFFHDPADVGNLISGSSAFPLPIDCSLPVSSVHGINFPRQEYWSRLPSPPSRDLPTPGIELVSPCTGRQILSVSECGPSQVLFILSLGCGCTQSLHTCYPHPSSGPVFVSFSSAHLACSVWSLMQELPSFPHADLINL